jgi:hypothetical protein
MGRSRPRFTIGRILFVIGFAGLALAALRGADEVWDSGAFAAALVLFLAGALLAVHREGRNRSYWSGFVLCGTTALVVSLIPPIEARLPTTKALTWLDSKVPGRNQAPIPAQTVLWSRLQSSAPGARTLTFSPDGSLLTDNVTGSSPSQAFTTLRFLSNTTTGTTERFVSIGHTIIALVFGMIGGTFSTWLWNRKHDRGGNRLTGPSSPSSSTG